MTSQHRPALGRGLSALIPANNTSGSVEMVDIDLIVPNPQQPRMHFDQQALEELAQSIREHGVLQPVIVTRVMSDLGPATYQLIAGERRLQAARIAGESRMPVLVKEAAGRELLEIALVENIQRRDLNPMEEATAFKRLADEFSLTQEQIAQRVGRGRVAVANTIRLLSLEEDIRISLASGQITEGHARALLGIDDGGTRLDVWRKIVADAMTVRQAEEISRALRVVPSPAARDGRTSSRRSDPHLQAIETELRHALGARVSIAKARNGGRVIISAHNDAELEGIIERLRAM